MAAAGQAQTSNNETGKYRAAKACRRCNQRRVKCDVLQHGIPCTRCSQSDTSDCVLMDSRRGTYPRKKVRLNNGDGIAAEGNTNTASGQGSDTSHNKANDGILPSKKTNQSQNPSTITEPGDLQQGSLSQINLQSRNTENDDAIPTNGGFQSLNNLHDDPFTISDLLSQDTSNRQVNVQNQTSSNRLTRDILQRTMSGESPEMSTPGSNATDGSSASYREISWTAMFDHFLDHRKGDRRDLIDKCSITYLGESFPLSIVLEDYRDGGRPRLHHPGPPLDEGHPTDPQSNDRASGHPAHMLPEDLDFLEAKKAFDTPPREILNALVSTFLERVYPLYPIVNRQEFLQQYQNKALPKIFLHALCFIASTFCPISILHRAGFTGRRQARYSYYSKAKALFDTGYENNKIVILQSVILLTFWGGGPNNYWNFYSWIGTAVTIAETLGMHRSLSGTNMQPQDRSLLKRLWWILVIRDASCGSLVGRPFRINMDHSDTEMLTMEDFEHTPSNETTTKHSVKAASFLYQIHMARLSLILREIVITRFSPGKTNQSMVRLNDLLQRWRQELPPELSWSDTTTELSVFSTCLSIVYNHHLILTHLERPSTKDAATVMNNMGVCPTPFQHILETAAQRISELASRMVTRSYALLMPHEAFQGLFIAEVIFYTQMKSTQPMVAQLGRMSLGSCQMVLHDAKEAWDPAPWVMKLFDNLIANLKEELPTQELDLLADPFGGTLGGGIQNVNFDSCSDPILSTAFDMGTGGDMFAGADYSFFNDYLGVLDAPGSFQ